GDHRHRAVRPGDRDVGAVPAAVESVHRPGRRRARGDVAGRGRPLPAGLEPRVPVGTSLADCAGFARPGRGHLAGDGRPDPRREGLAVHPRRGWTRPCARDRLSVRGLSGHRPGVPGPGDRARADRRRVGSGGHQRLSADHPRLLDPVDPVPSPGRPRPLPRGAARGDRLGQRRGLPGRQQRCLPLWLRDVPGGLRGGVHPSLRPARLARAAPRRSPLPRRRVPDRGRHPALHDPGPLRRGLPRALQVQPEQAQRDAGAVGLRARPLPDPRVRGDRRLRPHQAALLRHPRADQPDGHRPCRAGRVRVADPARPGL
ncbi:MAG: Glutathione S-transferase, omega, partial [uncultured Nocardioidaceae bacterium]